MLTVYHNGSCSRKGTHIFCRVLFSLPLVWKRFGMKESGKAMKLGQVVGRIGKLCQNQNWDPTYPDFRVPEIDYC